MDEDVVRELERLKEAIQDAKESLARYEGRRQELLARLEKEFGIKDLEEAKERLDALREEIAECEKELDKKFEELKEKWEW